MITRRLEKCYNTVPVLVVLAGVNGGIMYSSWLDQKIRRHYTVHNRNRQHYIKLTIYHITHLTSPPLPAPSTVLLEIIDH